MTVDSGAEAAGGGTARSGESGNPGASALPRVSGTGHVAVGAFVDEVANRTPLNRGAG